MANILFELSINAPSADVYAALTQEKGIMGWWTKSATIKAEVGSLAEFRFGPGALQFEVNQLQPGKLVVWKTVQGQPDWTGTKVRFELEDSDGGTKLRFGHRDFASEDGSFASTAYNWAYFILSLKSYLETGKGTPAGA